MRRHVQSVPNKCALLKRSTVKTRTVSLVFPLFMWPFSYLSTFS
uniref:Uncharacterized protein n=1 Tax=Anguilla anguilla TaxID=7936 RepID=A0A0E9PQW1_ANGAN